MSSNGKAYKNNNSDDRQSGAVVTVHTHGLHRLRYLVDSSLVCVRVCVYVYIYMYVFMYVRTYLDRQVEFYNESYFSQFFKCPLVGFFSLVSISFT
jgi:hypothetical protein